MKSLTNYIIESAQSNKLFDLLMDNIFCGVYEYEDDDEVEVDIKGLESIVKDFVKDAKSLKIESSVAKDYWDEFSKGIVKQNDAVEKEVEGVEDDFDWQEMDFFSLKVDGDVMLMTSCTHAPYNGDYFDAKITKIK